MVYFEGILPFGLKCRMPGSSLPNEMPLRSKTTHARASFDRREAFTPFRNTRRNLERFVLPELTGMKRRPERDKDFARWQIYRKFMKTKASLQSMGAHFYTPAMFPSSPTSIESARGW